MHLQVAKPMEAADIGWRRKGDVDTDQELDVDLDLDEEREVKAVQKRCEDCGVLLSSAASILRHRCSRKYQYVPTCLLPPPCPALPCPALPLSCRGPCPASPS